MPRSFFKELLKRRHGGPPAWIFHKRENEYRQMSLVLIPPNRQDETTHITHHSPTNVLQQHSTATPGRTITQTSRGVYSPKGAGVWIFNGLDQSIYGPHRRMWRKRLQKPATAEYRPSAAPGFRLSLHRRSSRTVIVMRTFAARVMLLFPQPGAIRIGIGGIVPVNV